MHLPPERENDQDFAAFRNDLEAGASLMVRVMSQKLELVSVTDQSGRNLTLVPAGTETGDANRLEALQQRLQKVEAALDAGNNHDMANSAALTPMVENMARITSHQGGRKVIIEEEATTMQQQTSDITNGRPASPYLTVQEAAEYLRTTVQAIYALVKRGRIKPMPGRPGRLLFKRQDLDDYLTGRYRR